MQQNQFLPSCIDYQQSIESLYEEITCLLENATEDFREFDGCTLYRGRIDALSLVKRRLEETFFVGEPDEPGFISLADAIEPGDVVMDRIMGKVCENLGSLKTINSMAMAIA